MREEICGTCGGGVETPGNTLCFHPSHPATQTNDDPSELHICPGSREEVCFGVGREREWIKAFTHPHHLNHQNYQHGTWQQFTIIYQSFTIVIALFYLFIYIYIRNIWGMRVLGFLFIM